MRRLTQAIVLTLIFALTFTFSAGPYVQMNEGIIFRSTAPSGSCDAGSSDVLAHDTGRIWRCNTTWQIVPLTSGGSGGISGSGTTDVVPKWASSSSLTDSLFSDDGTNPAIKSAGAAKLLFDTSLLEVVNAGDKLFYLWEQDIAQGVGGPGSGFNTLVVGGSESGTYGDGSMAMWSLDGNYPTTLRATGVYWQNDRDLFVSDFGGAGANLILGTSGDTRTEIRQPHTAGIINIQGFGSGARFEFTGNTSSEVVAFNGKTVTRGNNTTEGDLILSVTGKGLKISESSNGKMGRATLVAGTIVVNTTAVASGSEIHLTSQSDNGGTAGFLRVTARTAGTSFTITSSNGADTSIVAWVILDPS